MSEADETPKSADAAGLVDGNAELGRCSIHGLPFDIPTDCRRCAGDGILDDDRDFGCSPHFVPCWECHGSGVGRDECEMCLMEDDDTDTTLV